MKTLLISTIFLTNSALAVSSLTLYTTPPETHLDWSSPASLFTSVFKNTFFSSGNPLGSTVTEINCPNEQEILTIIPGELGLIGALFFEGRGLGLLYQTFPGKLVSAGKELEKNLQDEKTRFVRVEINAGQCARIKNFLTDFREKKIGERFGLPHRPLMAEGATDVSLAVSLMEVAGVFEQDQRQTWETGLFLPDKLSGMPLNDHYVGIFSLLGSSWGKGPDKSSVLKFWNPQKITDWVNEKIKNHPEMKVTQQKAVGVVTKKDHLPAPQGSYWQQANDPEYSKKKN
jgi:hypothetical protein